MNGPTIEIHGTGVHNHGAELMAMAVAERIRSTFPHVRIVVEPRFGPFESRARHAFLSTTEFGPGWAGNALGRWTPARIRRQAGIVRPEEVDIVLDASGFNFSDQWGHERARRLVRKMSGAARRHQPLVLLPQAFGPFEEPRVASWSRRLLARATLVYARDARSLGYVEELYPRSGARLSPDFTQDLAPRPSAFHFPDAPFAAIVPNARMLDKREDGQRYVAFLERVVHALPRHGLMPLIVLHDRYEDEQLVTLLADRGVAPPVVRHEDPAVLKWVLGRATLVLASRYHALVGAMSQGVVSIGCGWSHKYAGLFSDYGVPELLLKDLDSKAELDDLLSAQAIPARREATREALLLHATRLRQMNESMWLEVEELIQACSRKRARST